MVEKVMHSASERQPSARVLRGDPQKILQVNAKFFISARRTGTAISEFTASWTGSDRRFGSLPRSSGCRK